MLSMDCGHEGWTRDEIELANCQEHPLRRVQIKKRSARSRVVVEIAMRATTPTFGGEKDTQIDKQEADGNLVITKQSW